MDHAAHDHSAHSMDEQVGIFVNKGAVKQRLSAQSAVY